MRWFRFRPSARLLLLGSVCVALLAGAVAGCKCRSEESSNLAVVSSKPGLTATPKLLSPLSEVAPLGSFSSPEANRVFWAAPLGTRHPRPISVILPFFGADPEQVCKTWSKAAAERAFVLCLGAPSQLQSPGALQVSRRTLRFGLARLKARFGEYVAPGSIVLVARARAVALAVHLMREEPSFFARVLFIDVDAAPFSATFATIFARGGGQAISFLCTTADCEDAVRSRALFAKRAGLSVHQAKIDPKTLAEPATLVGLVGSLTQGDPRFAPWRAQ